MSRKMALVLVVLILGFALGFGFKAKKYRERYLEKFKKEIVFVRHLY